MSQQELLSKVIRALEGAGIEYMITGSIASSLHGEPRATHDIDLVVRMGPAAVAPLLAAFAPPEFFVEAAAVRSAVESRGMFNVVEAAEGDKVDFWLLTDSAFDRSRFSRRYREEVFGLGIYVPTPEDTILAKLQWAKMSGGSEKHVMDALRVYEVQAGTLDVEYLDLWAGNLSVADLWVRILHEAEPES